MKLAVATTLALLVAACAAPRAPAGPVAPPPAPVAAPVCEPPLEAADRAARHVIAQQEKLATMAPADVALEAGRAVDAAAAPQAAVDVALALGLTRASGDLARGQAVLDAVIRSPAPGAEAWRGVARLLAARYAEQRRAEDLADRTVQQLRDVQRDNQRKVDQLNEKLEALKAIERSLNTRPGASAPK